MILIIDCLGAYFMSTEGCQRRKLLKNVFNKKSFICQAHLSLCISLIWYLLQSREWQGSFPSLYMKTWKLSYVHSCFYSFIFFTQPCLCLHWGYQHKMSKHLALGSMRNVGKKTRKPLLFGRSRRKEGLFEKETLEMRLGRETDK